MICTFCVNQDSRWEIKHCLLVGRENADQFRDNACLGSCQSRNHYLAICKWGVSAWNSSQVCSSELNLSLSAKLHLPRMEKKIPPYWLMFYRETWNINLDILTLRLQFKNPFAYTFAEAWVQILAYLFIYRHCHSEQNKEYIVNFNIPSLEYKISLWCDNCFYLLGL